MFAKAIIRIMLSMRAGKTPHYALKITRPAEPPLPVRDLKLPGNISTSDAGTQRLIEDLFS